MASVADAGAGAAKASDGEADWLFDYMMSVFKSPTWEVPIMMWIDDNCIVFDSEEENKFAYTDLHQVRMLLPDTTHTPPPLRLLS